jgi:hypothetical protein
MHTRLHGATFALSCVCAAISSVQLLKAGTRALYACACATDVTGCWSVLQARRCTKLSIQQDTGTVHKQLAQGHLCVTPGTASRVEPISLSEDSPSAALRTPCFRSAPVNVSQLSLFAFALHRPVAQQLSIGLRTACCLRAPLCVAFLCHAKAKSQIAQALAATSRHLLS